MTQILAAADPGTIKNSLMEWGNMILTLDTASLGAAAIIQFVITILAGIYAFRLYKSNYKLQSHITYSFVVFMFFEALTKVLRIGNLLTNTETFANSPWSLPLTMCRVANATTSLIFLLMFINYIWQIRFQQKGPNQPIE